MVMETFKKKLKKILKILIFIFKIKDIFIKFSLFD